MKKLVLTLGLPTVLLVSTVASSMPIDLDFSGTFTADNDVVLVNFTVDTDSTITMFSSSWGDDTGDGSGYIAGGGFDPMLSLWDSDGDLIEEQDDGGVQGSTLSNGVGYTHGIWDAHLEVALDAGNYFVSISQYDNVALDFNFEDGFEYDDSPNYTFEEGYGSEPLFNGHWGVNEGNEDPRSGEWAFHIVNINADDVIDPPDDNPPANEVAEPATFALFSLGLLGLINRSRKQNCRSL